METSFVEQAQEIINPEATAGSFAVAETVEIIDASSYTEAVPAATIASDNDCKSTVGYCPSACGTAGYCVV